MMYYNTQEKIQKIKAGKIPYYYMNIVWHIKKKTK